MEEKRKFMSVLLSVEPADLDKLIEDTEPSEELTADEIQDCIETMEIIDGKRERYSDQKSSYVDGDEMFSKWTEVVPTFYGAGLISKVTKIVKNKFPTLVKLELE